MFSGQLKGNETRLSRVYLNKLHNELSIYNGLHPIQRMFIYEFIPQWWSQSGKKITGWMILSACLVLIKRTSYKLIIHSPRMFEIAEGCVPFLLPLSLYGNSSCCWRFFFLTVICPRHRQLADIYVVVLQLLQHVPYCRFFKVFASKRHVQFHCKEIVGGLKTSISFMCNWLTSD